MKQKVFVLGPLLRDVREKAAEIQVCKVLTFAIIGDTRCQIGKTAFFTREEADRAKIAQLRKAICPGLQKFNPSIYNAACRKLKQLQSPLQFVVEQAGKLEAFDKAIGEKLCLRRE